MLEMLIFHKQSLLDVLTKKNVFLNYYDSTQHSPSVDNAQSPRSNSISVSTAIFFPESSGIFGHFYICCVYSDVPKLKSGQ